MGFIDHHPLFVTALVALLSVSAGCWHATLGGAAVLALGGLGRIYKNWRTGIAFALVGAVSLAVFTIRIEQRNTAERALAAASAAEVKGRLVKNAKGARDFWSAPVILLDGPQPGAKVIWEGRGEVPVAGAVVQAKGNFAQIPERRNPGEFDQGEWLRNHDVAAVFKADLDETRVITGAVAAWGAKIRASFRAAVTCGLAEESQAALVIRAVVIGEQPPDAEALVSAFRQSGTLHAFSVSGLHVAMVGSIGWLLLSRLGVPRRTAVFVLLPIIFGYAWITGNSSPALRSAWMAAIFLGAFVGRRQPDLLNSLGAVLLAALLWDGRLLFQPGVQLSYGVVAVIALAGAWATRLFSSIAQPEIYLPASLMNWRQRLWLKFRRKTAQALGVSVAASIGSSPLTAFHFGMITPISILAGLPFVVLVYAILILAMAATMIYPLSPTAAGWINKGNAYFANGCVWVAKAFAAIPGGHWQFQQDDEPFLLVYDLEYGAAAACFSGGSSGAVLIDCGDRNRFKRQVAPSLRRMGIVPDSVILSHPDGHHLGGGAAVWEAFPIRQAVLPVEKSRSPTYRAWLNESAAAGVKITQVVDAQNFPMPDNARMEVVNVPNPDSNNAAADDRVAVYRLHWRGWKLLFTSDAGLATETQMLETRHDISADVIIAGHHRSDDSLGEPFLDAVRPQAIIAAHSEFPLAERLKPATVEYWSSRGIRVIHQGKSGGVTLKIDSSSNLRIEGFIDGSILTLKPR